MAAGSKGSDETTVSTSVPKRLFDVAEYYRMAEVGILGPEERLELIDGEVIARSPIGHRHAACVSRLDDLIREELRKRAIVSVQNPSRWDDHSEPQPDMALLRPRADYYASGHPGPSDVFLVIEVMDATANDDRATKLRLYARAEVAEVWLVDLGGQVVEAYRRPAAGAYTERSVYQRGQSLAPSAFRDLLLSVDAILGPETP
jgi:Uma2 family endonuclease